MQLKSLHPWTVDLTAATAIQRELARRVERDGPPVGARLVAGVDVGFPGGIGRAAVVLLSYPELVEVERGVASLPPPFPYVPGFLSFREVPIVAEAFARLSRVPDLVIVDGQGIAHPRGLGIAAHLGLLLDLPTIGCAKSRLVGQSAEPPDERGAWVPLRYHRETIGAVLRSRPGVKPLYISVGHRLDLEAAVAWTMRLTTRYRLPQPIRAAHRAASGGAS